MDSPVSSTITLNRAIPGQGLTNDPENPYPWEKPPEFTELEDGVQYVFSSLIEPDIYTSVMDVIDDGTPLMNITQGILFKGFTEGKWNPDLMMLLAEPTTYILMALAERADIDFKIYTGEEDDDENDSTLFDIKMIKEKIEKMKNFNTSKQIPKGVIPKEIEEQIEEMPSDSLLSRPEEVPPNSLLGRT